MEYFNFNGFRKYKTLYASRKRYLLEYIHFYEVNEEFQEYVVSLEYDNQDTVRLESYNSEGPALVKVKDYDNKLCALQFFIDGVLEGSQLFYKYDKGRLVLKRIEYYSDGVLHRIGGPALIIYDVSVLEFINHSSSTHRTFFVDTIYISEYWINGVRMDK